VGTLLAEGGRPGTLVVTLIYAFVGTGVQYAIGLALAFLTVQRLSGQRFFRVVYILPLTITPVGVAYMFRMLTDTARGPFTPLWNAFGLQDFALLGDPWGARLAVIIGDAWQWIPFMYIVLLAALEGRDLEVEEAGLVDGASKSQIFRHITFPAIIPVSATVILIRLIEAFKIIDLPNIMTNGGPGTATESVTLQAFLTWRGFNLGLSAATAYTLLIVVTLIATAYVATVIRRTHTVAR
jgi:multiple sugar transport system permease protein